MILELFSQRFRRRLGDIGRLSRVSLFVLGFLNISRTRVFLTIFNDRIRGNLVSRTRESCRYIVALETMSFGASYLGTGWALDHHDFGCLQVGSEFVRRAAIT